MNLTKTKKERSKLKSYFVVGENGSGKINTKGLNATERKYFAEVRSRLNAEFVTLAGLDALLRKKVDEKIEIILSGQLGEKEKALREKYPDTKIILYKSFLSNRRSKNSV